MKILVLNPSVYSVYNLRGELLRSMTDAGHEVVGACPQENADLSPFGVRSVHLAFDRTKKNPFSDALVIFRTFRLIRKERPDLVFSYCIKPVIYACIGARIAHVPRKGVYAMISGLGKIYGDGTSVSEKTIRSLTSFLLRRSFKGCERVIFQNTDDAEEFVARRLVKKKRCAVVSGSGVNMEKFTPSPLPDQPVFLMMSRMLFEKGVIQYCEAARAAKKEVPSARFLLCGFLERHPDEIRMEHLQPFIDDGSIEYLGGVKDVRPVLAQSTVYVQPSFYREGVPHSSLEAMACGRPIITTNSIGCREVVQDGVNGILVEPKNAPELAQAFVRLANDHTLCERMGEESLRYCRERFDVNIVNEHMLRIMGLLPGETTKKA